ncbi:hypothetical protein TREMEDRAFT_35989 [Tremella mesenterica DSM 1558]|uniref:uncharacterized protein n=1 Tax=Tremella mesenterica (strain ATCC 24925 / CBS 8224 / DSM 1558 / NBRC 9311 / NRRL Y-6157 / RJB 2259-6 / UBC 559-6) TaxID=578456 RepID=UPI00032D0749|nr:uncharacterized protein TREMEDRAFT_35989 [Tremella mesenterica DSM 1558]EIW65879.1 hypothetical protein TREMEDRAFT_35989 [Tremella mesenterica DSM 1558]
MSPLQREVEFLRVEGSNITLSGKPIVLKGAGLGGWMNMENFITGYPGHEHQMRAALRTTMGQDKYEFFFDKATFLEYFFQKADAAFIASLGLNCLRLPVNYRHFEDDSNPRVFKSDGLKHLDRVIDLCAKHGIYTIIDLHSAPGGQNIDWHCDAGNHQANFWVHKDFQDRAIAIWEHLAEHYKGNTWVAGYNPLNEPTDSEHVRLLSFYQRVEKAIRAVDPDHILFLDTFGEDLSRFGDPLPNCVYACHDYSMYGKPDQVAHHRKSFDRKVEYMRRIGGPIWNGEFGPVYASSSDSNHEQINQSRYAVLEHQLSIYAQAKASWSIWLYKDIGFQGKMYVNPDTEYMKLLGPFLDKKKRLAVDAWAVDEENVKHIFDPLNNWLEENISNVNHEKRYPPMWKMSRHVSRMVREILLSEELVHEYAQYFCDKSKDELEELAKSFAFENCIQRERLNDILKKDAGGEVMIAA